MNLSKIVFNENDLTIGDLEDFEDAIGVPLTKAIQPVTLKDEDGKTVRHNCDEDECEDDPCKDNGRPVQTVNISGKVLKGLVWIAKRQDDETFSLEDARKVKVTELDIVREDDSKGEDPKE